MNEKHIVESFQNFLKGKDLNEKSLSLRILPDLFINYYRDIEFIEVDKENDGDMLLFEYGTYNWETETFFRLILPVNFTKSFQMIITKFINPEDFEDVMPFNQWSSPYKNLSEYRNVIINSLGYKRALKKTFIKMEISLDLA